MPLDISYFKAIHGGTGLSSSQDLRINENKSRLKEDLISSINYKPLATRNGVLQPIVLVNGKSGFKGTVLALPDDNLSVGDMIVCDGNHWLVVEISSTNPIQKSGTVWLCNQLFRFQNFNSTIIERWGVFDSGAYSKTEDKQIQTADSWYRIFLPYDDDTKKIFVDKRLATNKGFNSNGDEILTAYKVTSVDPVSKNYGENGHLLVLVAESSPYQVSEDNIDKLICNYIAESGSGGTHSPTLLPCSITSSRSTIRTGTSYTFDAVFYESDGITINNDVVPSWSIEPSIIGVSGTLIGNSFKVSVKNDDALIGEGFIVSVTDSNGLYNIATANVEVV